MGSSPNLVFAPVARRLMRMRMSTVLARLPILPLRMRVYWKASWEGGGYH
jgi:hypothetical protein